MQENSLNGARRVVGELRRYSATPKGRRSMNILQRLERLSDSEKAVRGVLHTPREIAQQPDTWKSTYRIVAESADRVREFLRGAGLTGPPDARPTVFLTGAGTSDYIGRSLAPLLRRAWHTEVFPVSSTELLTSMDDFAAADRRRLWISFSRSGDSSEGVAVLEEALDRYPGVTHLVVTCNASGRMARDFEGRPNLARIVLDDAVNDRGLAMTSSFTNMVVAGQCLSHVFEPGGYGPILERLVAAGRDLLPRAAVAADRLVDEGFSKVCFLGTGALAGAAAEAALKVLELTAGRITTLSESFLGVRHGPLSAVDGETLVVGFVSGDERRRGYELDLLAELGSKRLAKRVVCVAPGDSAAGAADEVLSVPDLGEDGDYYRPALDVTVAQLIGLAASLDLGLTPDAPSPNGAISRVVTQVRIH
jgi:tagatose-6-phosphate ketose/aldose isomerase